MLRYTVDDMTCGHCVQSVTKAVAAIDPAATVAIDLPTKRVEVSTTADGDVVAGAIREAGYTPVPADASGAPAANGGCCGHC